jgi:hypothetical protein
MREGLKKTGETSGAGVGATRSDGLGLRYAIRWRPLTRHMAALVARPIDIAPTRPHPPAGAGEGDTRAAFPGHAHPGHALARGAAAWAQSGAIDSASRLVALNAAIDSAAAPCRTQFGARISNLLVKS